MATEFAGWHAESPNEIKRPWDEIVKSHGMSQEGSIVTLTRWFVSRQPAVQKFAIARMTEDGILDRARAIQAKGGRAPSSASGRPGSCRPSGPGSAELADEVVDEGFVAQRADDWKRKAKGA
jgi:hypothetical protein